MRQDLLSRITIEPGKCGGKPCIRGRRMRVADILAAITYAGQQTDHVVLTPA